MDFLGHELWIDGPNHGHLESPCLLKLKYGHNLSLDGRVDISQVTVNLTEPQGQVVPLVMYSAPDSTTDAYLASFTPSSEGYYTVWADYQAGIWCEGVNRCWYYAPKNHCPEVISSRRYRQFIKTILPVGHGLAPYSPASLGTPMDIIPQNFHAFSEGEELTVQVMYQDKPLPGANLRIAGATPLKVHECEADAQGMATITFNSFGQWIILASYDDYERGSAGEFDAEQFSTVLSVKVMP